LLNKNKNKEQKMQGSKLYVGNLSYTVTGDALQTLFAQHGEVKEVKIIGDKGFGFVEMASQAEAEEAKKALDGFALEGRNIRVDVARPKSNNRSRDFKRY
jgi:RNA recognition motif-containing protein